MGRWTIVGFALAAATLAALPAIAADSKDSKKPAAADKKKKDGPLLRWAHKYSEAVAEAQERNCVLYVTMHAEH